jgi:hypothetical protein
MVPRSLCAKAAIVKKKQTIARDEGRKRHLPIPITVVLKLIRGSLNLSMACFLSGKIALPSTAGRCRLILSSL